jgi:hypothetical protein
MGKLVISSRLPYTYQHAQFITLMREMESQVNLLAEGQIAASYSAYTAAPTGTAQAYSQGDFLRNSQPTELGAAGSKYVVLGFVCVASGTPGTWVACRCLTGN